MELIPEAVVTVFERDRKEWELIDDNDALNKFFATKVTALVATQLPIRIDEAEAIGEDMKAQAIDLQIKLYDLVLPFVADAMKNLAVVMKNKQDLAN